MNPGEIDVPCRKDPGQVVCTWIKCLDLVELLEQANREFLNLEIHLQESRPAKWSVGGKLQLSVTPESERNYHSEIALLIG